MAEEAKLHGPLDSFSNYPFENYLFQIKQLLKNGNLPLAQIFNRMFEQSLSNVRKYSEKIRADEFVLGKKQLVKPEFNNLLTSMFNFVKFQNFELKDKMPNDICYLRDGHVMKIEAIGESDGNIFVIGRKFVNYMPIPNYPCDSRIIGCHLVDFLSENLSKISLQDIERKGFLMPYFQDDRFVVQPLLHSF